MDATTKNTFNINKSLEDIVGNLGKIAQNLKNSKVLDTIETSAMDFADTTKDTRREIEEDVINIKSEAKSIVKRLECSLSKYC